MPNDGTGQGMSGKLDGKAALVTGGDQGIGRAIAIRLAHEGADVAIVFHTNRDGADEMVREIEGAGRRSRAIQADVGQVFDAPRIISEAVAHLGRLEILVNNAGVEKNAPFWEVTEEDFDRVLNTNLKGLFFVTQAMARYLMNGKREGKIINISSVHEDLPFPHFTPYCASKGGVKMITRNLAIELAPFGITVHSVAPGAIKTPLNQPLLTDPEKLK